MTRREWGALFLVFLMACAGSPRGVAASRDPYEAELEAIRYDLRVLTAGAVDTEPVEVDEDDFQEAMQVLARHMRASDRPRDTARWLMEGELQADLLAEVEGENTARVVVLVVTAAVGGGAARFSQRLPLLPDYGHESKRVQRRYDSQSQG